MSEEYAVKTFKEFLEEREKVIKAKGMTVDDLREIYEGVPTRTRIRTASVQKQQPKTKSKVRLRTASTDESNNNNNNYYRATNDKFANAYLGNNDLYDDYIT